MLGHTKVALLFITIVYAFLTGFRTIQDTDLGWQLATGRWILEHHRIASADVFSYTAQGRPWIYPPFSGVLFYCLYLLGGYAALTWFTAAASATTAFLLTRRARLVTIVLTIVAVPVVARQLDPRADLFTTVLFAATLSVLWQYYRTGEAKLWLLPIFSLMWVNLHWGFVVGLGLCLAYLMLESCEMLFSQRRAQSVVRLRKAWPWLLAMAIATFVNPWGPRIYAEMVGWGKGLADPQSAIVTEFAPLRFNWANLQWAAQWRYPESAIWWLLFVTVFAAITSVALRRPGVALLLIASALPAIERSRFQAMFACIVALVGGTILSEAWESLRARKSSYAWTNGTFAAVIILGFCVASEGLATFRSYELVSNHYYLSQPTPLLFGAGISSWYPERAAAFITRERLPGNIFNLVGLGGYIAWRLPEHPDFYDGRGKPFPSEVFRANLELPSQPPDSDDWTHAADTWGINTIFVSLDRFEGLVNFPRLREFCASHNWQPVYLDDVSAVFLRRNPQTQPLIERLGIDCQTVSFSPPGRLFSSSRTRAEIFNFWSNSALILEKLGRMGEATQALENAQAIFPDSGPLHFQRGVLLFELGNLPDAERELRRAIELLPDESPWDVLSVVLKNERRYAEAEEALRHAAELSQQPAQIQSDYLQLGRLELQLNKPREALAAFDRAANFDFLPSFMHTADEFHAAIAAGRARAWWELGDPTRATSFQEQAVRFTPNNAARWKDLAYLYQAQGRTSEAQHALEKTNR